ncbi:MAG: hypothetical protein RLZZ543_630 [Bacteroidota bacterium]|jgi:uncharacterized protein
MKNISIGPIDLLIFQSTPFCNLDCKYCYLPSRNSTDKIDLKIIEKTLVNIIEEGLVKDEIDILWHAGEPLVMPISFYEEVILIIKKCIPSSIKIRHQFQTNATLIDDEWCNFFIKENIEIGISLDGPKHINDRNRLYRNQKGSFDKILAGIGFLKKHKIEFSAIAVITDYSIDFPEEIYNFFMDIGVVSLGFNIDEEEGINTKSTFNDSLQPKIKSFWRKIFQLQLNLNHFQNIREIRQFNNTLINTNLDRNAMPFGQMTQPLSILTIDTKGNFSTFSPELLGMEDSRFNNFHFGNVNTNSFSSIVNNENFLTIFQEISDGIQKCSNTCDYFSFCGGGAPSNKLYENGSFNSTETKYCKYGTKALVDVVLDELEDGLGIK